MRTRIVLGLSAVITTSLMSITARAQETGFAVNRFEPSERGSTWFAMESLDFRGDARPALGIVGDFQYRPLAIYGDNGDVRSSVVRHMLTTHVGASFVLAERFRFAVSLPVHLYNEGEPGRLQGRVYTAPRDEQGIGDLRFGVDARLFGKWDALASVAVGAQLWVPTGDTQSYTSDGRARVAPRVLFAGQAGWFAYSAKVGAMIRDPEAANFANSPIGHELTYGAALGVRASDNRLTIGPEAFGSTVLTDAVFKTRTTPFEVLLGTHYNFAGGLRLGAGVGPGLTRGYGSPAVRALLSLEWSPDIIDDKDGDGIKDSEDACPDTPGKKTDDPRTNGCADKDGDGILDPLDACVDVPGVASTDPKANGCPELDSDKDGILDKEDACPKEPGLRTNDPKTNGCPDPDRDKDSITNDVDACPDEPGKPDPDPKKNGCPKAFVAQGQIKILDQVKFKVGSAQILPGKDSEEILEAVLKVLNSHAEITKVRIEGHTDNTGGAALNRKLSKDRAASVAAWLVKNGIDKGRLTSDGFGPDKPIDNNATDEGRRNNRRVEFHIVEPSTPAQAH